MASEKPTPSEKTPIHIKPSDISKIENPIEVLGYRKTLIYSCIQPAMLLLFLAAAVRHTGERPSN